MTTYIRQNAENRVFVRQTWKMPYIYTDLAEISQRGRTWAAVFATERIKINDV